MEFTLSWETKLVSSLNLLTWFQLAELMWRTFLCSHWSLGGSHAFFLLPDPQTDSSLYISSTRLPTAGPESRVPAEQLRCSLNPDPEKSSLFLQSRRNVFVDERRREDSLAAKPTPGLRAGPPAQRQTHRVPCACCAQQPRAASVLRLAPRSQTFPSSFRSHL